MENTIDPGYLYIGYLEQPLVSKRKSNAEKSNIRHQYIVDKRAGAISPLFHNIFNI